MARRARAGRGRALGSSGPAVGPCAGVSVGGADNCDRRGGHDVPEDIVRRRCAGGLRCFFTLYQGVLDTWQVFDNSDLAGPRLIASGRTGTPPEILDASAWKQLLEKQR